MANYAKGVVQWAINSVSSGTGRPGFEQPRLARARENLWPLLLRMARGPSRSGTRRAVSKLGDWAHANQRTVGVVAC